MIDDYWLSSEGGIGGDLTEVAYTSLNRTGMGDTDVHLLTGRLHGDTIRRFRGSNVSYSTRC
jgi:hypothetical protein